MIGYCCTESIEFELKKGVIYQTHGWTFNIYFYHIDTGVYMDEVLRELWS